MIRFLLALSILISICSCAPSDHIDKYASFFVNDKTPLEANQVSVTYFGVSHLLFDDGDTQFVIDGFLTRPSATKVLFGKLSTDTVLIQSFVREYHLENLEAVLVNHAHYDHALDAAYFADYTGAKLFGSSSTINLGRGEQIKETLLFEFEAGSTFKIGDFTIEILKGRHSPTKVLNADLGEEIESPLEQPARFSAYKEGGTFDFLIHRGDLTFFVKASPNFIPNALDGVKADVAFLATGSIGTSGRDFIDTYIKETIGKINPDVVIPIHWDNFLKKNTQDLVFMPYYMDRAKRTFEALINETKEQGISFEILLGHSRRVFPYSSL